MQYRNLARILRHSSVYSKQRAMSIITTIIVLLILSAISAALLTSYTAQQGTTNARLQETRLEFAMDAALASLLNGPPSLPTCKSGSGFPAKAVYSTGGGSGSFVNSAISSTIDFSPSSVPLAMGDDFFSINYTIVCIGSVGGAKLYKIIVNGTSSDSACSNVQTNLNTTCANGFKTAMYYH